MYSFFFSFTSLITVPGTLANGARSLSGVRIPRREPRRGPTACGGAGAYRK